MAIYHGSTGPWSRFYIDTHGHSLFQENGGGGAACAINFNAILEYKRLTYFNKGGSGQLSGTKISKGRTRSSHGFTNITCAYRTAWQLTDNKFGGDARTVSLAITCLVSLEQEIGTFHFRNFINAGRVCRALAVESMQLKLTLFSSGDNTSGAKSSTETVSLESLSEGKRKLKGRGRRRKSAFKPPVYTGPIDGNKTIVAIFSSYPHVLDGSFRFGSAPSVDTHPAAWGGVPIRSVQRLSGSQLSFAVCVVLPFRSPFSPYMLLAFVHHYQSLGLSVLVFDKYGAHKRFLRHLLPSPGRNRRPKGMGSQGLPGLVYFPFTVFEKLDPEWLRNTRGNVPLRRRTKARDSNELEDDDSRYTLKSYYGKEIAGAHAAKRGVSASSPKSADLLDIEVTLAIDRDKTATYDFARIEFPHFKAILFADADEMLVCQGERPTAARLRETFLESLSAMQGAGFEEVRIDVHPVRAHAPDTILSLKQCLQTAYHRYEIEIGLSSLSATTDRIPPQGGFDRSDSETAIVELSNTTRSFHRCFSNVTTAQAWPKSVEMGNRCPFHYNHWSCDGGKLGGRQPNCRCRVATYPWYKRGYATKKPESDQNGRCYLLHYNSNLFRYADKGKYHGPRPDRSYVGSSPLALD
jgi:hypothetical protein